VGFWRLSDGEGNFFGHSVWIECVVKSTCVDIAATHPLHRINVIAPSTQDDNSAEGSMASSSIIMPASANGPVAHVATESTVGTATSSAATARTESAEGSDSASLISIPSSNDDDESAWEDSRSHVLVSPPVQYVVLYDSSSEEES
jgi:next-to-BRCA1 protein 1